MKSTQERFEEKFIKLGPDDCWIWTAGKNVKGYGKFQHKLAHRVSYELYKGKIPEGQLVRHKVCDNHACVNPNHLETGTVQDNSDDMVKAGRQGRKLTPDDVAQIKAVLKTKPSFGIGAKLGRLFGIKDTAINRIKTGGSWPDVEPADKIEINLDDLV